RVGRMKTEWLQTTSEKRKASIKKAVSYLKEGKVVAIPTETVYGLAADATNEEAINNIFRAKERPQDNPLIVHVATKEQLLQYATHVRPYVEALIDAFSPGPITYVLRCNGRVANNVTAGLDTVGIRIPDHDITEELLKEVRLPLAAPSANLSGRPSPTSAQHVMEDLSGKIAAVLDGGPTEIGIESTVVDCTEEVPIILRPGAITKSDIIQVVGKVAEQTSAQTNETPRSPGQKYVHYAPEVPLILVCDHARLLETVEKEINFSRRVAVILTNEERDIKHATDVVFLGKESTHQMQKLYDVLRSYTKHDVDVII